MMIVITILTLRIYVQQNTMFEYTWNDLLDAWNPAFKVIRSKYTYRYRICFVSLLLIKGSRKCHSKVHHFGILIILSWRKLRKSRYRMSFCPPYIYLKTEHKPPLWGCSPPAPISHTRKRISTLTWERRWHQESLHKQILLTK